MAKQIESVVESLRSRIVAGQYAPGQRLLELSLSAELGTSRTPIRLAFEELEKEGLVERLPTRGFRVRAFDADEIAEAVDVRGVLEGMAARLVAERGPTPEVLAALRSCVDEGESLLQATRDGAHPLDGPAWIAMNARFHAALVGACGNRALMSALEHVARRPLASAAALTLPGTVPRLEQRFIERAQQDHADLVSALEARQAVRAEALMREHAYRSRENKRLLRSGTPPSMPVDGF
ncbi:GntR family transcriptional regulator [Ramlibacter sp. AW1]|uniref:GntR family transcriptional regulator n=1 Tax=Ramlibacter aurantiacus TaxID=2801330 RepID=A0A936ZQ19_9BURK|nr:GntR family transcriptional regulator [Ramlibacter aurantiacus]MBL0418905.1 GntR family transcriptional regulator [Ramlibacter aurantiacus]